MITISEESLRLLSELFNGDNPNYYNYKTGPQIYQFFNKYFEFNESYWGKNQPSRRTITSNFISQVIKRGGFNKFINIILSIEYFKKEYPLADNANSVDSIHSVLNYMNNFLESDGCRIVYRDAKYILTSINDDEELLGKGGFASCYYIKSKQLVEKRLNESEYGNKGVVSRFKREFEITRSLNDIDGVIKVFNYNESTLSYTMEKGEIDLHNYIINGNLDNDHKRIIAYQICTIMSMVHKRSIIHRDLSPSNIFIISGMIKIADFGLGKNLAVIHSHLTTETRGYGTFFYCDPRQINKLKDGDYLSDIFSIGRIINFIFTGNPLDNNHIYRVVTSRATSDNESNRYQTVDDMINAMKSLDDISNNANLKKAFESKANNPNSKFNESDAMFIESMDAHTFFKYIHLIHFREELVRLRESLLIDEKAFISKLDALLAFVGDSFALNWEDYDEVGFLGSTILFSKCSYYEKLKAIELINIPISANRYGFINMVLRDIIGNIDPTLEEHIDKRIKDYL